MSERPRDLSGESTAELVRDLSQQTSKLISQELQLAKLELAEKGKRAGIGVGAFGAAGVCALYGVGALIATIIAALATVIDHTWLAAAIVTVALFAFAGVLALFGKKQVDEATTPPEAIDSVKQDIETTKASAQRGRT